MRMIDARNELAPPRPGVAGSQRTRGGAGPSGRSERVAPPPGTGRGIRCIHGRRPGGPKPKRVELSGAWRRLKSIRASSRRLQIGSMRPPGSWSAPPSAQPRRASGRGRRIAGRSRSTRERAASLSGLSDAENPGYALSITWPLDAGLKRARATTAGAPSMTSPRARESKRRRTPLRAVPSTAMHIDNCGVPESKTGIRVSWWTSPSCRERGGSAAHGALYGADLARHARGHRHGSPFRSRLPRGDRAVCRIPCAVERGGADAVECPVALPFHRERCGKDAGGLNLYRQRVRTSSACVHQALRDYADVRTKNWRWRAGRG